MVQSSAAFPPLLTWPAGTPEEPRQLPRSLDARPQIIHGRHGWCNISVSGGSSKASSHPTPPAVSARRSSCLQQLLNFSAPAFKYGAAAAASPEKASERADVLTRRDGNSSAGPMAFPQSHAARMNELAAKCDTLRFMSVCGVWNLNAVPCVLLSKLFGNICCSNRCCKNDTSRSRCVTFQFISQHIIIIIIADHPVVEQKNRNTIKNEIFTDMWGYYKTVKSLLLHKWQEATL